VEFPIEKGPEKLYDCLHQGKAGCRRLGWSCFQEHLSSDSETFEMASFSSFQSTHTATTFHNSELQVGGIIRNQIRDEAKDEIESWTGRIRPLDGNLLQQQRKGIYQEIPLRKRNVRSNTEL
jgi:hypothetical protein